MKIMDLQLIHKRRSNKTLKDKTCSKNDTHSKPTQIKRYTNKVEYFIVQLTQSTSSVRAQDNNLIVKSKPTTKIERNTLWHLLKGRQRKVKRSHSRKIFPYQRSVQMTVENRAAHKIIHHTPPPNHIKHTRDERNKHQKTEKVS